jgi:CheY-like chemotaxis protein
MSLPLLQQPGSIAVLDDDYAYLETVSMILPKHWPVMCYARQQACIDHINGQAALRAAQQRQRLEWINHWRDGKPLLPHVLETLRHTAPPYEMVKTLVIDYSMPGKNGLQVLEEIHESPTARILLTGQADEQLAVRAFNGGLIEQFIPKQLENVGQRLTLVVSDMLKAHDQKASDMWQCVFSKQQQAVLHVPSVKLDLHEMLSTRLVEYVLLSEPFGALGFDAQGRAAWLQLETRDSLDDLLEIGYAQRLPSDILTQVQQGSLLLSLELQQTLGLSDVSLTSQARPVGLQDELYGAWFELPNHQWRPAEHSYAHFLKQQSREVID